MKHLRKLSLSSITIRNIVSFNTKQVASIFQVPKLAYNNSTKAAISTSPDARIPPEAVKNVSVGADENEGLPSEGAIDDEFERKEETPRSSHQSFSSSISANGKPGDTAVSQNEGTTGATASTTPPEDGEATIPPKPLLFDGDTEVLTPEQKKQKEELIKELTRRLSGPLMDENGCIPTGNERPTAIEVDGPSHFYANSTRYTAYTKLKHRLLTRMGYRVLHVPYFEWRKLRGAQEREEYMRNKLAENPTEWLDPEDETFYKQRMQNLQFNAKNKVGTDEAYSKVEAKGDIKAMQERPEQAGTNAERFEDDVLNTSGNDASSAEAVDDIDGALSGGGMQKELKDMEIEKSEEKNIQECTNTAALLSDSAISPASGSHSKINTFEELSNYGDSSPTTSSTLYKSSQYSKNSNDPPQPHQMYYSPPESKFKAEENSKEDAQLFQSSSGWKRQKYGPPYKKPQVATPAAHAQDPMNTKKWSAAPPTEDMDEKERKTYHSSTPREMETRTSTTYEHPTDAPHPSHNAYTQNRSYSPYTPTPMHDQPYPSHNPHPHPNSDYAYHPPPPPPQPQYTPQHKSVIEQSHYHQTSQPHQYEHSKQRPYAQTRPNQPRQYQPRPYVQPRPNIHANSDAQPLQYVPPYPPYGHPYPPYGHPYPPYSHPYPPYSHPYPPYPPYVHPHPYGQPPPYTPSYPYGQPPPYGPPYPPQQPPPQSQQKSKAHLPSNVAQHADGESHIDSTSNPSHTPPSIADSNIQNNCSHQEDGNPSTYTATPPTTPLHSSPHENQRPPHPYYPPSYNPSYPPYYPPVFPHYHYPPIYRKRLPKNVDTTIDAASHDIISNEEITDPTKKRNR